MKQFIGVDLHKQTSYVTRINERGKILEQVNLVNDADTLRGYFSRQRADSQIAVEATGNWMYLYELIEDRYPDLVLAHPQKTKAIASARIKTDKIDSSILAHLLRTDLLPTAYIPTRAVRDSREVLRYRAALVSFRTMIKNRISAILSKTGVRPPTKTTFGVKSRRFLSSVAVRSCYRLELDGYLRLLEHLHEEIEKATEKIEAQAKMDAQAQLLITMPGIGAYSALLILSEIGDINRFPDSRRLCSYAGLVPSVYSSGEKTRLGRLTKQGSKWLRWILVELSVHAINKAPQFRSLYIRVSRKHGRNTARVAVARGMLRAIYAMLKKQEPFRMMVKESTGQRPGVMATA